MANPGRNRAEAAIPPIVMTILRQLSTLALTFIGLTLITFVIGRVMPADPVLAMVGDRASAEVYETVYHELGLDKPLI